MRKKRYYLTHKGVTSLNCKLGDIGEGASLSLPYEVMYLICSEGSRGLSSTELFERGFSGDMISGMEVGNFITSDSRRYFK